MIKKDENLKVAVPVAYWRHTRRILSVMLLGSLAMPSLAWKPKTHIYLTDLAIQDAKDGKVTIHRVNYETGAILGVLGEYTVDPSVLAAINNHRKILNAGVLGPDAYPDVVTGQTIIHPRNSKDEGTNSWLEHVWNQSRNSSNKVKAFITGFLIHGAGDMYAHTYVNKYAGGDFEFAQNNALRHTVLEGYLGKLTPLPVEKDFSIFDGPDSKSSEVSNWIYDNMINAVPGSVLDKKLLIVGLDEEGNPSTTAKFSVPRIFSKLKASLVTEKARYASMPLEKDPAARLKAQYIEAWIADIDKGLKAWPHFSEQVARFVVYPEILNLTKRQKDQFVQTTVNNYVNQHLLSMAGAPDVVGAVRQAGQNFVKQWLGPFEDLVAEYVEDLKNKLFEKAFGISYDDFSEYVTSPETHFDRFLGPGSIGSRAAARITLAQFKQNELKLKPDGNWILESFPPAYNTVLMTKLIFLGKAEYQRLINDLKAAPLPTGVRIPNRTVNIGTKVGSFGAFTLTEDNAMLGFNQKFDGSTQWRVNGAPNQMALERAGVYEKIFMKQFGEEETIAPPPPVQAVKKVTVTITRVENIDDDIDVALLAGPADFYATIKLGEELTTTPIKVGDNKHSPNWTATQEVVGKTVTIVISLLDDDSPTTADDLCDINPASGKKRLTVTYNLETGVISGNASGTKGNEITVRGAGDDDKCMLKFKITHQ